MREGGGDRGRGETPLKVFLLTLALLLPDGRAIDVPIEIWTFPSGADCAMSAEHLNKGRPRGLHAYRCVETDAIAVADMRERIRTSYLDLPNNP